MNHIKELLKDVLPQLPAGRAPKPKVSEEQEPAPVSQDSRGTYPSDYDYEGE